eukprot:5583009-Lingulodinium_polyedra.AAC.1
MSSSEFAEQVRNPGALLFPRDSRFEALPRLRSLLGPDYGELCRRNVAAGLQARLRPDQAPTHAGRRFEAAAFA